MTDRVAGLRYACYIVASKIQVIYLLVACITPDLQRMVV